MRISQISTSPQVTPNFGMKFTLKRIETICEECRCDAGFFNHDYQKGLIAKSVLKLPPAEDEFVLRLGYPEYEPDRFHPILKSSYEMFVDLVGPKEKKTYNLSEKNVILRYTTGMNKLEIHPQGPFHKLMDFIGELSEGNVH